jgi:hypothetical protein
VGENVGWHFTTEGFHSTGSTIDCWGITNPPIDELLQSFKKTSWSCSRPATSPDRAYYSRSARACSTTLAAGGDDGAGSRSRLRRGSERSWYALTSTPGHRGRGHPSHPSRLPEQRSPATTGGRDESHRPRESGGIAALERCAARLLGGTPATGDRGADCRALGCRRKHLGRALGRPGAHLSVRRRPSLPTSEIGRRSTWSSLRQRPLITPRAAPGAP